MSFALRAAAAVFATAVALAAGAVRGAPVPEPGYALSALEFAGVAPPCTEDRELGAYQPSDASPESAARPAEPLPGLGLSNGAEPLIAHERRSVARAVAPVLSQRVRPPPFARHMAAARDGTLSARSTGLPPPA